MYENSNNGISFQQNVPSSPQTIKKARKDIKNGNIELEIIQIITPLLNRHDTLQPRNHQGKLRMLICLDKFLKRKSVSKGRNWITSKNY